MYTWVRIYDYISHSVEVILMGITESLVLEVMLMSITESLVLEVMLVFEILNMNACS